MSTSQAELEPIERASVDELRALQLARLQWSLRHAYENVPHYRRTFDAAGVRPSDLRRLEDLARFPFLTKQDFRRTRTEVDELTDTLKSHGYGAQALHGGMEQKQRDRVMALFRSEKADVLVATDVAARGLDIEHVSHVINYDIPTSPEVYVHRIGRTGRVGRRALRSRWSIRANSGLCAASRPSRGTRSRSPRCRRSRPSRRSGST